MTFDLSLSFQQSNMAGCHEEDLAAVVLRGSTLLATTIGIPSFHDAMSSQRFTTLFCAAVFRAVPLKWHTSSFICTCTKIRCNSLDQEIDQVDTVISH
jgi:hypothetical protein